MTRYTRSKQDKYERLKAKGVKGLLALAVFDWLCCNTISNIAGLYIIPFEVLRDDLQLSEKSPKSVVKALLHLEECGVIRYDDRTKTVWIKGYIEHNIPSDNLSHKNVKGLISVLQHCRRLPFFNDLLREYPWLQPAFPNNTDANTDAISDAISEPITDTNNQSAISNHYITYPNTENTDAPEKPKQPSKPKPKPFPDELPPEFVKAVKVAYNNPDQKPTAADWDFWRYLRNETRDPHRRSFTPWEIVTTIVLARRDEFWTKQMGSFVALGNKTPKVGPDDRKSTRGQPIKFVTIFNQFEPDLIRLREKVRLERQVKAQHAPPPPTPDPASNEGRKTIADLAKRLSA